MIDEKLTRSHQQRLEMLARPPRTRVADEIVRQWDELPSICGIVPEHCDRRTGHYLASTIDEPLVPSVIADALARSAWIELPVNGERA